MENFKKKNSEIILLKFKKINLLISFLPESDNVKLR